MAGGQHAHVQVQSEQPSSPTTTTPAAAGQAAASTQPAPADVAATADLAAAVVPLQQPHQAVVVVPPPPHSQQPPPTPAPAASERVNQPQHRPPPVRRLLNLAELSDGASVVAANIEARRPERAIDRDIDSFMKNDCEADKWMIIELSQVCSVCVCWGCLWRVDVRIWVCWTSSRGILVGHDMLLVQAATITLTRMLCRAVMCAMSCCVCCAVGHC